RLGHIRPGAVRKIAGAGFLAVVPQRQVGGPLRVAVLLGRQHRGELGDPEAVLGDRLGVTHPGLPPACPAQALEDSHLVAECGDRGGGIGHGNLHPRQTYNGCSTSLRTFGDRRAAQAPRSTPTRGRDVEPAGGPRTHRPTPNTKSAARHRRPAADPLSLEPYFNSAELLPSSRRAMISCWICWVPSKMSRIFESRLHFSSNESSL